MGTGAIWAATEMAGLVTQLNAVAADMDSAVAQLHGGQARFEHQVAAPA